MTTLSELFPRARRLAYETRQQSGSFPTPSFLTTLKSLEADLDTLDTLVAKESASGRQIWKRKLHGLKEDAAAARRVVERHGRASDAGVAHRRERDELLHRRRRVADGGDVGNLVDEGASLGRSLNEVTDMLESGKGSLGELKAQRKRMTGVQGALADMADTLGISSSVMRIVQRRDVTDRYIVYGGMALTLIVMYLCWR